VSCNEFQCVALCCTVYTWAASQRSRSASIAISNGRPCSVLQCVLQGVLQCVTVSCCGLQQGAPPLRLQTAAPAVCCSVCCRVCCSMLQCVAVCCSVLQQGASQPQFHTAAPTMCVAVSPCRVCCSCTGCHSVYCSELQRVVVCISNGRPCRAGFMTFI